MNHGELPGFDPHERMAYNADLPVIDCGTIGSNRTRLRAVFGMRSTESSFKALLGLGLLLLGYERGELRRGQPVIESTSGSLGLSMAAAGRVLGNPIQLVSDANILPVTRRKIELLGAKLHVVTQPHPVGGTQQARIELLPILMKQNPELYWTRQNDSDLNPAVYRRWMIPRMAPKIDFERIDAAIFVVGTGGHFVAFAELLRSHGIPCYVADRTGSITFGGKPHPSIIRGAGNQNAVPKVIGSNMHLVEDVYYGSDEDAASGVTALAERGIYVGGSSGLAFHGATQLAEDVRAREILTFFPDRGEIYGDQFLGRSATPNVTESRQVAA